MITVRKLIAELKKMPPDAYVVTRDHDQSDDEMNGYVVRIQIAPDELIAARVACGEYPRKLVVLQS